MINVTKPFLPPTAEYISYVEQIFARNWLTNLGPLVNELELKIKEYLDVPRQYSLKKMAFVRNFNHTSPVYFDGFGINGKNSELHAAMGLCNLKYIQESLSTQKKLVLQKRV